MKQWTAYKFDSCKQQMTSQWIMGCVYEYGSKQLSQHQKSENRLKDQ